VLMARGWNNERSYNLESARLISYTIAGANRDPKKSFPSIYKFLPLPTDNEQHEDSEEDIKRHQAELIARINKAFDKNLKVSA
jgi:hypothetical protein